MQPVVRHFGMFAKYWQPGTVKTRLGQAVGMTCSAEIYRAFVECLKHRGGSWGDARTIYFAPPTANGDFAEWTTEQWQLAAQADGDLGTRMLRYFEDTTAPDQISLLIGSDAPTLPADFVEEAFRALTSVDVVLGPSEDGGYYLIGMRCPHAALFRNIDWSTPDVWPQTLAALQSASLSWHSLPAWWDVDDVESLERLRREIEATNDPTVEQLRNALQMALE